MYNGIKECEVSSMCEDVKIENSITDKLEHIESNLDIIYDTLNILDCIINGGNKSEDCKYEKPISMNDHLDRLINKSDYLRELIDKIKNQF